MSENIKKKIKSLVTNLVAEAYECLDKLINMDKNVTEWDTSIEEYVKKILTCQESDIKSTYC